MKIGDMDYEVLLKLFRALVARRVEYVIVGAVALALHGIVRGTQDVDLFVRPTEENVARLREALFDVWQDPAISEINAAELAGEIPVVRFTPADEMTVDVIARLGEAFAFDQIEWEEVDADGVKVRVATPRMLLRMKKDTLRPIDGRDAEELRERFGLEDA
jgi:hypothetical protein